MLVIRFKGWSVKLDHQVGSAGKHGIWSFHGSESSYVPDMETILRHAAIRPAEPAEGKSTEVEVAICRPGDPEEKWIPVGKGVAVYEAER
ncbi:TPA: hypothetical protein ACMFRC_001085 [Pseudomonas aeruginosa]|nr:hypothetical protein [Pseudomonas aeruginosa]